MAPPVLLGTKIGMTRVFDADGINVPVTVIQGGPCPISQVKTEETDGYHAVQLAFDEIRGRSSTKPLIGHDAKAGTNPHRHHREFRLDPEKMADVELGQVLGVEGFDNTYFVDVIGTSKGKGTAGVMKRWGFKGQPASHGTERKHRSPGSINGRATYLGGGRPKKGIKMNGQMGNARVTARSLPVIQVDTDKGLLLVKGPVPGANGGVVMIREAIRLYTPKAEKLAKAS